MAENDKPLRKISEAFKGLAATVNSQSADVELAPFSHACSLVSPLFGCLGIAFKFAEMDYVAKVGFTLFLKIITVILNLMKLIKLIFFIVLIMTRLFKLESKFVECIIVNSCSY